MGANASGKGHAAKGMDVVAKAAGTRAKVSERRIKEAAKELRRLMGVRDGECGLGEAESLEWAARMLGFESYEDSRRTGPSAGATGLKVAYGTAQEAGLFGKKKRDLFLGELAMLGHEVVTGSTGAGKTDSLVIRTREWMEAAPELGWIYMDGKGDASLFWRLHTHSLDLRLEGKIRVVNMMTMSRVFTGSGDERLSHTFNPIDGMDGAATARWMEATFGDLARRRGVGKEASALFEAAAFAHAAVKGGGGEDPGVAGLAAWVSLRRLEKVWGGSRSALPAEAWEKLDALAEIGGSDWGSGALPVAEALCAGPMKGWAENMAPAFATRKAASGAWLAPEVPRDWALEGGYLLVLLPALEKSVEEMELLGKGMVAALSAAWDEAPCRPGSMKALAIFDEVGYYAPDSYADMMASARGAGVGLILGGQDMPGFCRSWRRGEAGEEAAQRRLADLCSCSVKTIMKSEDPGEMTRRFAEAAFGSSAPSVQELRNLRMGQSWGAMPGFSGRSEFRWREADSKDQGRLSLARAEALPAPAAQWGAPR